MRSRLAAILLAAMMFLSAVAVFSDSDCSDADGTTYTVKGYIGLEGGTALASKVVVIRDNTAILGQGTTNSDGAFSMEITASDVTALFIRIVYEGTAGGDNEVDYKIVSAPKGIESKGAAGDDRTEWALDLSAFTLVGDTYTISSSLDHAIFVTSGMAHVGFHVIGKDNKDLYGAKINLYDGTKIVASGTTDYYGVLELKSLIPYDTYRLVVKCNGHVDYDESIVINDASVYPEITLTAKETPTFYGMTTYHFLMLIGIVLGLSLVVISYILVVRNWKGMEED